MTKGRLTSLPVSSSALAGNRLGDRTERALWVYLPPSYDDSDARYPVLFVLTGFTGRGRMAVNDNPWSPGLDVRMDRLLAAGRCGPAILVFPDCFTRLGGSQYVNSLHNGAYEDHLIDELVPLVDDSLRTLGAGHRGVIGKSSGGFAALRLTMRHPDVFSALASHSGDVCFELCYAPDFPAVARGLAKAGSIDAFLTEFDAREKKSSEQIQVLNILAMAAAYSPTEAGFDLPFDLHDLTLREDVWTRWLAYDPLRMVDDPACQAALRACKLVFIDAGTRDQYNLDFGARRLVKRLTELGIEHVYEEFADDHFSLSYRYDESLPRLVTALSS